MSKAHDAVSQFYLKHLTGDWQEKFITDCPFCKGKDRQKGRLVVFLNRDSFFHGYFRCVNHCVPGGFPLWFAQLASLSLSEVPGYDPDLDTVTEQPDFPVENINDEVRNFHDRVTEGIYRRFEESTINKVVLRELQVGFNGRYVVYPYIQEDGNCYSARCVHPEKMEDYFWHGSERFSEEPFNLFNVQDLKHCENGAIFLCEGEENLLALKQLGFPGVAISHYNCLEKIPVRVFDRLKTLFICVANSPEGEKSARSLAARVGYKARILTWPVGSPRRYNLFQLAKDSGKGFGSKIGEMIQMSRAFSPFSSPQREYHYFLQTLEKEQGDEYLNLGSGFARLDAAIGGIHGINVIGGAPKVGKSTFLIQIASQMALRKIPVLYYDFENGRQKIYQRTLSRLARLTTEQLGIQRSTKEQATRYEAACRKLKKMLFFWRVINDRKVTPELMRRHVDFIRHETRSDYTVVVIDSLHKLPFNDFTERRTGIDAWLRQLESIRDELQVSFLVISELTRGAAGSYRDEPHLGVFKGSGDIEYSADNAMVLQRRDQENGEATKPSENGNTLSLVASREHSPGRVADYRLDFPYWGFTEHSLELSE